jgi:hypothetical protein
MFCPVRIAAGNDAYTKALLHFDGSDGSTTFTDSNAGGSAHTWTATPSAQISTAQSKFGGAAGLFDGNTDCLSTPSHSDFDLTGDFTIDFWFRVAALNRFNTFLTRENQANGTAEIMCRINSSNEFDFFIRTGSGGGTIIGRITVASGVSVDTWYHAAYVRSGNDFTLYKDGVSLGTASSSSAGSSGVSQAILVGGRVSAPTDGHNGYLDELRISSGIARWTAGFTPPAEAYG